jgi:hypothetical protein
MEDAKSVWFAALPVVSWATRQFTESSESHHVFWDDSTETRGPKSVTISCYTTYVAFSFVERAKMVLVLPT